MDHESIARTESLKKHKELEAARVAVRKTSARTAGMLEAERNALLVFLACTLLALFFRGSSSTAVLIAIMVTVMQLNHIKRAKRTVSDDDARLEAAVMSLPSFATSSSTLLTTFGNEEEEEEEEEAEQRKKGGGDDDEEEDEDLKKKPIQYNFDRTEGEESRAPAPAPAPSEVEQDSRPIFRFYRGGDQYNVSLVRTPETMRVVKELAYVWPPVVDGYGFKTEAEVEAVIALKATLSDLHDVCDFPSFNIHDNRVLLRYARARKLNIKKAAALFREAYQFHKTKRPTEFMMNKYKIHPALDAYGTGGSVGRDKDNDIVFIDCLGRIDPVGLCKRVTPDDFVEFETAMLEIGSAEMDRLTAVDHRLHMSVTIIVDLKGLGMHHLHAPGLAALKKVAANNDTSYAELAKRVLVINAPWAFSVIWKVVEFFFDEATREKIQIYSNGATDVLLKYIDADQLPKALGGTRCENGDYMSPPIRVGGPVPKDFPM